MVFGKTMLQLVDYWKVTRSEKWRKYEYFVYFFEQIV